jgi:hypothetical protein
MPLYPIACKCGFRGDVFERAANVANLICPKCLEHAEQDWAAKNIGNGNREFHGHKRESITDWYHPSEVTEARQSLGKSAACVQDNGTVLFANRATQRQYQIDKADIMRRAGRDPRSLGKKPAKTVNSGE